MFKSFKITTDVSAQLLNYAPSSDLYGYVGMRTHIVKMDQLLCLDWWSEDNTVGMKSFI